MKRELLVKVLESARGRPLSVDDILIRAGIDVGEKPVARRELRALVHEGRIAAEGKRFVAKEPEAKPEKPPERASVPTEATRPVKPLARPKSEDGSITGPLHRHRDGYGFITPIEGGDDLFVPPQAVGDALDGDLVRARPGPGRDGRPVAKSVEVVERRRQLAVGTYRVAPGRGGAWIEPRDQALPSILVRPSRDVSDGDVVRVSLDKFEDGQVFGAVLSRLGRPGDPDAEVLSVAYGEGFSDIFPPDVLAAAESVPPTVRDEDKAGRRDLTAMPLVTIDGEDARDFDDAVHVERTSRGYRLVVAIADVTAYVTEGSVLDREAFKRATSVYFPQHVLPMLPERLSNGICSLNPNVERLCMVADMLLADDGASVSSEIYPAVMKSRARCTYTQVAQLLAGEAVASLDDLRTMLTDAGELAKKLTKRRMQRGAIDFDLPEAHVVMGDDHQVRAIERRPRNDAHRLVEEFMLAANEAVARYFEERELPTVYRVHGSPKEEKLRAFADLAGAFGYEIPIDPKGGISAAALNDFLARVEGRPEQRALNHLLLRSMMQAVYSSENIGHFGLAAPSYLHFTSPIRRYPDLIVHRLLKAHWSRGGKVLGDKVRAKETEQLEEIAVHCSERERASTSAEREIDAYYAAAFLTNRVGDRFDGTVSSIAEFGLFVELDEPFVEGLVRADTLGERANLDATHHRLDVGGRSFSVGERVQVEVASSDPVTRRIDLRLIDKGKKVERESRPRLLTDAIDDLKKRRRSGGKPPGKQGGKPGGKPSPRQKQERRPKQKHQRRK